MSGQLYSLRLSPNLGGRSAGGSSVVYTVVGFVSTMGSAIAEQYTFGLLCLFLQHCSSLITNGVQYLIFILRRSTKSGLLPIGSDAR